MSPAEVSKHNEAQLWQKQFGKEKQQQQQYKFQIGDRVRLAKKMNPFSKGYKGNWTREVFTVKEINRLHHFPMFYLEDDKGEPIKGAFYSQQIQKVSENVGAKKTSQENLHEIERLIGRAKKINGVWHRYVKWKHFPASHNQWIPLSEIKKQS